MTTVHYALSRPVIATREEGVVTPISGSFTRNEIPLRDHLAAEIEGRHGMKAGEWPIFYRGGIKYVVGITLKP